MKKVPYKVENIVRKEKLLVTSNFSFSHNVFYTYISLVRQNAALCGNEFSGCKHIYVGHMHFSLYKSGFQQPRKRRLLNPLPDNKF